MNFNYNTMKKTVKILMSLLFLNLFSIVASAQDAPLQDAKREKIKAEKVAYITTQVKLTPTEAENFWPIYNQMQDEKSDIMKNFCQKHQKKNLPDPTTLTDEQAQKLLDQEMQKEVKMLALKQKYHEEFKKIISPKKLYLFYEAERNFKKELLKKMKNDRPDKNCPAK